MVEHRHPLVRSGKTVDMLYFLSWRPVQFVEELRSDAVESKNTGYISAFMTHLIIPLLLRPCLHPMRGGIGCIDPRDPEEQEG